MNSRGGTTPAAQGYRCSISCLVEPLEANGKGAYAAPFHKNAKAKTSWVSQASCRRIAGIEDSSARFELEALTLSDVLQEVVV